MKSEGKTLLSNSAWSLLNQVARVGTLALVTITLSRHFGPTRFGSLAYGLALVRIFAIFAGFGLDRILVKRFAETLENPAGLLPEAFWVKLTIGLACYGSLLLVAFLLNSHDPLIFSIVGLAGVGLIFQAFDVFDYFFQAVNRFRLTFFGRAVPVLVSTGIKVGAVLAGAPLLVFAGLETVETALVAIALFFLYRRARPTTHVPRLTLNRRHLLREGFPLVLGTLGVMIYMRSDILLLGRIAGYEAAGIYVAAAQVTEACALFPLALMPALFPMLIRWRNRGLKSYQIQFTWLFGAAILCALGVAAGLTITAPLLIRLLYGAAYAPAVGVLMIHAWSALFIYISIMQSGYDITEGLTWLAALRTGAGAMLNIALNLALIPRFGPTGSACATLISQFFSAFLFNFAHPRTRPIFFLQLRAFSLVPLIRLLLDSPGKVRSLSGFRRFATEQ